MNVLLGFKILGIAIAAIAGVLPNFVTTLNERGRLTRAGKFLISLVLIGVFTAATTEVLDQRQRARSETFAEKWALLSGQRIGAFTFGAFLKKNDAPIFLISKTCIISFDANSPLEKQYLVPPRTIVGGFQWGPSSDELDSARMSARFAFSSMKGARNLLEFLGDRLIPNRFDPVKVFNANTQTAYLLANPTGSDNIAGRVNTDLGRTYGILVAEDLHPFNDRLGGIIGTTEWGPLGLEESVTTLQEIPQISKLEVLFGRGSGGEEVDAILIGFVTLGGSEVKSYYKMPVPVDPDGFRRASITGQQLYQDLKESFKIRGSSAPTLIGSKSKTALDEFLGE